MPVQMLVKAPIPQETRERELVKFCLVEFLPEHLILDITGVYFIRNLQRGWGGRTPWYVLTIENNTKQLNC